MRKKPNKETSVQTAKMMEEFKKKGINVLSWYWTLGRYDVVFIYEAEGEQDALRMSFEANDFVTSETLVAIPNEEAIRLL